MSEENGEKLTPTEDLVLEVLAARHRLGEHLWTFDSCHAKTLRQLVERGYVTTMHGNVENTLRASLTPKGRERELSPGFMPPILREADQRLTHALEVGDKFGRFSDQWVDAIRSLQRFLRGQDGDN